MKRPLPSIPIVIFGVAGALVGCGNGDDNDSSVPIVDATAGDAVVPPAGLRVANWAWALSPPAVDVCLSGAGLNMFRGPVLAHAYVPGDGGFDDDAGTLGVSFAQASAYIPVAPGPYDLRFVSAGASDCSQGIAPDLPNAGAFASATASTVAILGVEGAPDPATSLRALSLVDDSVVTGTKAAVRFINALPSVASPDGTSLDAPTVDLGTGITSDSGAGTFKPIFIGVPFGGVSDKGETQVPTLSATASVDAHGYGAVGPFVQTTLTSHQSGTTFDLANATVSIAGGAAVTAVLLPLGCDSSDAGCAYEAELVLYVDNAGTVGRLSSCITCADGGAP